MESRDEPQPEAKEDRSEEPRSQAEPFTSVVYSTLQFPVDANGSPV